MENIQVKYPFKLLVSSPLELKEMDSEDLSVSEALQSIYSYGRESSVYMKWNNYIIELNLAAQIADIFSDILLMLHRLNDKNKRGFDIHWGSSSFMAQWHFEEDEKGMLTIKAYWTSVTGGKEVLNVLSKVSDTIHMKKRTFIEEWMILLGVIEKDLVLAGYKIDQLKELGEIKKIVESPGLL